PAAVGRGQRGPRSARVHDGRRPRAREETGRPVRGRADGEAAPDGRIESSELAEYPRPVATEAPLPVEVEAGRAVYSRFVLACYAVFVLGFSARFAWRCPRARMLEQYQELAGPRHLDVGVGTGWFLAHCHWRDARPDVTLLDLNENSLHAAAGRIARLST